ncbi:DNA-3-methyladenine glycosylase I [Pseudomaricurvus alcaniphilus]|uniref:DNA-3-methyladenine glycosylase I n=1 Tax=Pseudomaricurvus alcaniphilus TaxID=1166482 RepID=UPI0014098BD4|nr:DNA-3-methyladenine glycosylase I [Pseudomaricurvus alcaniphilus]NHN38577.1 DNA-3-methyladenine glycosylase I [Pseudomaricurvus alcaniphilus]
MTEKRCPWCLGDPLYQDYHDREWGSPCYDDHTLFEFLLLEGAQAGLAWITVLRKRENYRQAFDHFDAERIARYSERKLEKLRNNPGIIRNRLKIASAVQNARAYLALKEQHDSFASYLWQFVDGAPIQNRFQSLAELPAATPASERMSKALKQSGFNFVGPTICYAFMQATGMVNDHLVSCPRHQQVQQQHKSVPDLPCR